MKFEIEQEDSYAILTLKTERLDSKVAPDLKSQIIFLANSSDENHLIVDLQSVNFADSSGLSALLMAHRLYRDSDRSLILCGLQNRITKLLDISQLNDIFITAENRNGALEYINQTKE